MGKAMNAVVVTIGVAGLLVNVCLMCAGLRMDARQRQAMLRKSPRLSMAPRVPDPGLYAESDSQRK
jgi:hypothetical protein